MNTITVETSARHVHVTKEDLEILFGKGYELTVKKWLSLPGQFASNEKVAVIGSKSQFPSVSILGPVRTATQVELSATDARTVGITAPVRESGNLAGSGACKIVGPAGEIEIKEGVIIAKRHIHLDPDTAAKYELKDKQIVSVKVNTPDRSLTFGDVVVRVRGDFLPFMHIDTDEANAMLAPTPTVEGEIIP